VLERASGANSLSGRSPLLGTVVDRLSWQADPGWMADRVKRIGQGVRRDRRVTSKRTHEAGAASQQRDVMVSDVHTAEDRPESPAAGAAISPLSGGDEASVPGSQRGR
jgi:hypothetical protein